MRTLRAGAAVGLVAVGIGIGYLASQPGISAASSGLTAQDHADIEQLYWRYNHGADFGDPDLYASAFSADATLHSSTGRSFQGRDEIRAFIAEAAADRLGQDAGRRHWNNGWRLVPTASGAKARVYWLLLGVGGGSPTSDRSGYYEDEYEKTSEGWLITSRTIIGDGS